MCARLDDEDEFQDHAVSMAFPHDVIVRAREAADFLLGLSAGAIAPFGLATLEEALRFYGCEHAHIRGGA